MLACNGVGKNIDNHIVSLKYRSFETKFILGKTGCTSLSYYSVQSVSFFLIRASKMANNDFHIEKELPSYITVLG